MAFTSAAPSRKASASNASAAAKKLPCIAAGGTALPPSSWCTSSIVQRCTGTAVTASPEARSTASRRAMDVLCAGKLCDAPSIVSSVRLEGGGGPEGAVTGAAPLRARCSTMARVVGHSKMRVGERSTSNAFDRLPTKAAAAIDSTPASIRGVSRSVAPSSSPVASSRSARTLADEISLLATRDGGAASTASSRGRYSAKSPVPAVD
eukprot:416139-Prymnesium_polylepis.1